MKYPHLVVLVALAGCQAGPQFVSYKAGSVHAERQYSFDQCKIASLQEIPQSMATSVSGGYYNPGTLSCTSYGNTTSCNRVGAVDIPATATTYDQNQGLRERYIIRCMQAKGFAMLENVPVCKSEAEKRKALYDPQPANASELQCTSGVPLDS